MREYFHDQRALVKGRMYGDLVPITPGRVLAEGRLFLLAEMPDAVAHLFDGTEHRERQVGLFTEDDGQFFLVETFSSAWLTDLVRVARVGQRAAARAGMPTTLGNDA